MADFSDEAQLLPVPGAELYLELVGPEGAPAILYLHGGPGYSSHSFRDLMEDDLERYRVVYADQRGTGRSLAEGGFTLEDMADDVARIVEELALPDVTLLAHGFGAMIAVAAAARRPGAGLVDWGAKLLLVNPWVDMPLLARSLQREAAYQSGHTDEAMPPEGAIAPQVSVDPDALLEQAFGWVASKQLLDSMQFPKASSRLRLEHSDATAISGVEAGATPAGVWSLSVRELLPSLTGRVVVLVGREDKTSYPDQAELVLEAQPGALVSLLDAGHYPWLDDPETFVSLVHEVMAL